MSAKAGTKVVVEQDEARDELPFEEIAVRAHEIYLSGAGGDEVGNWLRAESELIAELQAAEPHAAQEDEQDADIAA